MLTKFFKKDKPLIEFSCLIPEVAKTMPIISASEYKFDWFNSAISTFKKQKNEKSQGESFRHVVKCPGINLISRKGWIQRTYQDIWIKTEGTGGFSWKTPLDQTSLIHDHEYKFPYIGHHDASLVEPMKIDRARNLPIILKIQSPWIVKIPKDHYLLILPIPYPDDKRFTSTAGIIDPDLGINFLNTQIFWHCLDSEELIPAGTPLAQYFLIKKEDPDFITRAATIEDIRLLRERRLQMDSTFVSSYSKLKKMLGED